MDNCEISNKKSEKSVPVVEPKESDSKPKLKSILRTSSFAAAINDGQKVTGRPIPSQIETVKNKDAARLSNARNGSIRDSGPKSIIGKNSIKIDKEDSKSVEEDADSENVVIEDGSPE